MGLFIVVILLIVCLFGLIGYAGWCDYQYRMKQEETRQAYYKAYQSYEARKRNTDSKANGKTEEENKVQTKQANMQT